MNNLILKNLSITYKKSNVTILENANLELHPGDFVLLEGNNGSGKSSILKTILLIDKNIKKITGDIIIGDLGNVVDNNIQKIRSQVAFLDQKDDFDSFSNVTILDFLSDSYEAYVERKLNKEDIRYISTIFNKYFNGKKVTLKTSLNKLSGGQQRLVSIIASLCLRDKANLFIVDEPLNNLDISMIKTISNVLNDIRIENPNSIMILVSHCKIFPFINSLVKIENKKLILEKGTNICYSCFGKPDDNGYYQD